MADNVDPSKNTLEGFSNANTGDNTQRRPSYSSVWTRESSTDANNQVYSPSEQPSQAIPNKKSGFFKSLNRSLSRKVDLFSSPNVRLSSSFEQVQVHNIEQGQNENIGEDYSPEGEYYNYERPYKKKGLSVSMVLFIFDRDIII